MNPDSLTLPFRKRKELSPMDDTLIRRLQKDLPLTLQPPRIPRAEETAHPVSLEHPWGTYFLSCGIAGTRRGRIWSLWSGNEDGPCGCLMLARSDDEGRTWSPPQLVLEARRTPGGFPLSNKNGALWCDPEGGLWLFFSQSLGYFDGRSGVWAVRCADPDAETPEWGEPSRLWHGVPLNKPCVRRNGEWVLPLSLGIRRFASFDGESLPDSLFAELDSLRGAHVLVSSDSGRSWERRGFQNCTDPTFYEKHVLEKQNGVLKMYARDRWGILSAESSDEGWHWTPFRREFCSVSARFHVSRLPSGNWLMLRYDTDDLADDPDRRKNITAFLSEDEGGTWRGGLLLDGREKVSYPDAFVHPDGRIFTQHDYLRKDGCLVLSVFREEDVLAGRPVTDAVRLGVSFPSRLTGDCLTV